jgi:uncharacterized protein YdgA (DUF945 family)
MKKSIVAAIVLVACLLLAPFGFGKLAEKRVNAGLDKLVEQAPFLVIKERTWQGGWFKSSQQVRFELAPAIMALANPAAMRAAAMDMQSSEVEVTAAAGEGPAPAVGEAAPSEGAVTAEEPATPEPAPPEPATAVPGFTIRNDVVHGPVLGSAGFGLARVDTEFVLPEEIAARISGIFGTEPALQVSSRVGFISGGSTTVTSQGRTIATGIGDSELTYETAKLVLGYGGNLDTYDADGSLPRLEVKSAQGAGVVLTDMSLRAEGKRAVGELYDGDFALELEELKATNAGQDYTVADLHYVTDTRTDDGFTDIGARMGSGAVTAAPLAAFGLDLKEVHYDMSFRHLHAETLEKMLTGMRDVYLRLPAGGDPVALATAMQAQILEPLKAHANELLRHDPVLGFDRVGLVTADGEGVIRGTVKLVGASTADFSAETAMGLLGKVELDLTIEIAQALASKIPNGAMYVGMAESQGLVTRDGDKLVCHIEFKGGALRINGKAQPLPPGMVPGVAPAAGGA